MSGKELVDFVTEEWEKAETIKTHEVVNNLGEVEHRGTKNSCKIYVSANGPLGEILGISYKIRKIK